jgi:hypothetical protein
MENKEIENGELRMENSESEFRMENSENHPVTQNTRATLPTFTPLADAAAGTPAFVRTGA